jgi:hybrid cluster-associated redox disulfide protein
MGERRTHGALSEQAFFFPSPKLSFRIYLTDAANPSIIVSNPNKRKEIHTMKKVTKQTIIGDILDAAPDTAVFFLEIGMHCLGCPMSRGESIEEACAVHDTDADALVEKINAFLAENA